MHIFYFQDVARDVVNSVRSNAVNMINAVQELQKSHIDSDSQRAIGDVIDDAK